MSHVNLPQLVSLIASSVEAGLSYGHLLQVAGKRDLSPERLMHFQTRVLGTTGPERPCLR